MNERAKPRHVQIEEAELYDIYEMDERFNTMVALSEAK